MDYQRVAARLQQSMSQVLAENTANYEGKIALLQEQYETTIEQLNEEIKTLKENTDVEKSPGA